MRSGGLWHPGLASAVVSAGHGDMIVVSDAGLPIPQHVERIDLAWARGEPAFVPVLTKICDELIVESAVISSQTPAEMAEAIDGATGHVPTSKVDHEELKRLVAAARVVVRTGEDTPFANVVLLAGVAFG